MKICPNCDSPLTYPEKCGTLERPGCGWVWRVPSESWNDRLAEKLSREALQAVPEDIKKLSVDECRALVRKLAAKRSTYPGQDWVSKLKAREEAGEVLPLISQQAIKEFFGE